MSSTWRTEALERTERPWGGCETVSKVAGNKVVHPQDNYGRA